MAQTAQIAIGSLISLYQLRNPKVEICKFFLFVATRYQERLTRQSGAPWREAKYVEKPLWDMEQWDKGDICRLDPKHMKNSLNSVPDKDRESMLIEAEAGSGVTAVPLSKYSDCSFIAAEVGYRQPADRHSLWQAI